MNDTSNVRVRETPSILHENDSLLSKDDSDVKQQNNAILSSLNVSKSGIDNIDIGSLDNFVKKVNPLDAFSILKSLRSKNIDKIVIAQLNINSLRNKFDQLLSIIQGNVDILVITETKLDETFPISQFMIDGYSIPYRLDRNRDGSRILVFVREDIPSKKLHKHTTRRH